MARRVWREDRRYPSERNLTATSAGTGGRGWVAVAGIGSASAQAGKRDQYAPELANVIDIHQPIEELGTRFGGGANTEGPVWWKDDGASCCSVRSATTSG